jgi:hypothetical protein
LERNADAAITAGSDLLPHVAGGTAACRSLGNEVIAGMGALQ